MTEEDWRKEAESDKPGPMTALDWANWLKDEIKQTSREAELRIQDATDFVTAYAMGKLTQEQVELRHSIYSSRWGETGLAGVNITDRMTNEEILQRLDSSLPKTVREGIKRKLDELAKGQRQR